MDNNAGEQAAKNIKDASKAIAGDPISQAKIGLKLGCGMLVLFATLFTIFFSVSLENTGAETPESNDDEIANVDGDVEFWFTTYDPAKGGINGRDCGGAVLKVCSNNDSPTGYVGKYGGKIISNGVIAVPQDTKYHSSGKVDINEIPVPLLHSSKVLSQAKIIIPGYNNSNPVPVGDHFASTVTKPNRLDLACKDYCPKMVKYLKKNRLILDSKSGLNGGTKVLGKIVGEVTK